VFETDDRVSRLVYEHFSNLDMGIPEADRVSLGSAFRLLHQISLALRELDLDATEMPLRSWAHSTRLEGLESHGYELKFELWMAIGPVGQLARLVDECAFLCAGKSGTPSNPECISYSTVPDSTCLFRSRRIDSEWMIFLRELRLRCLTLDAEIQALPDEPLDLRHLLFHGYLTVALLHQALTILEFAELSSEEPSERE
jgi:hypothetical protein